MKDSAYSTSRRFWRSFGKALISAAFLTYIGFALALPTITTASVYIFLRSFEVVPSGVIAWLAVGLLGAGAIGGFGYFFWDVRRQRRRVFEGVKIRITPWVIFGPGFAMLLMIGPAIALVLWSDMEDMTGPGKGKGSRVVWTREMQLHSTIRGIERRGFFRWSFD